VPPAARPLARLALGWAALADFVPLYPLYALLFVDTGLGDTEISALFAIWTVVGMLAEVPTGVLADRFSRRGALVVGALFQAAGYALWITLPGFEAFAAGFVLWGVGGAFTSGALEALVYDGLAAVGAEAHYPGLSGRMQAVGLLVQVPTAAAATMLFAFGGYAAVGWVSVATWLGAAAVARRLPEQSRTTSDEDAEGSWWGVLRGGLTVAVTRPGLLPALAGVTALGGIDAIDEYFPLLTAAHGVPTTGVPQAMIALSLVGAVCSAQAAWGTRLRPFVLGVMLAAAAGALVVVAAPGLWGVVALVAFYGPYRLVLVVVEARLQHRIDAATRATVTSVASLGTEVTALVVVGLWPLGGALAVAGLTALLAVLVLATLRGPRA
jgi:MFS family permease